MKKLQSLKSKEAENHINGNCYRKNRFKRGNT